MRLDEAGDKPGLLAFTLTLAGLIDLALASSLMLYPANGTFGLPPADAPLLPRLAAGPLAGLAAAQLATTSRPTAAVSWGAGLAKLVLFATIAAHLLAPGTAVTERGRAVLWALAAVLGGLGLLLMLTAPVPGARGRHP